MADVVSLGQAGLKGWREKVGDAVAEPLARRTPLTDAQVRALVGATFLALSVTYVVKATRDVARQLRG